MKFGAGRSWKARQVMEQGAKLWAWGEALDFIDDCEVEMGAMMGVSKCEN